MRFDAGTFTAAAALAALLLAPAVVAEVPEAVSPGSAARMARIGDPCPTFSWTEVPGAERYELVVYSVGEAEGESRQLQHQRLPGAATSWTPSLDSCLDRGGRYAWIVRVASKKGVSEWSAPSLFEVAAGSSKAELEGVLEVARRYLEGPSADVSTNKSRVASGEAQKTSTGSLGPQGADTPVSLASVAGDSEVNGAAVVTMATLGPGLCLIVDYRWVDLGDGTVLDCNTKKIWLKDAACVGGGLSWDETGGTSIFTKVADLNGGTEFNCAGYTAGTYTDWEVPALEDLCGLWDGSCTGTSCCAASQGIVDPAFSNPSVADAVGDRRWTEEDAFVNVQSNVYWSATVFDANDAWIVYLGNGGVDMTSRDFPFFVWPVRGGQ
jgi:hypothetical protein